MFHTTDEKVEKVSSAVEQGSRRAENLPDDGVRKLQTLQTQVLQKLAATDYTLQSRGGDYGVGQIHLNQLQWAEQ